MNNHRNRLKQMCDLYLYNHFNSDGHCIDDMYIMPIEEVVLTSNDKVSISSKLLTREEFWYRELCSIYPYGLNDNVRQFGSVSKKIGTGLVVYGMFNKQTRKFRKRLNKRRRGRIHRNIVEETFREIVHGYNSPTFSHDVKTFLCSLPNRKLSIVWHIIEELLLEDKITSRVAMLLRDFIAYRNGFRGDHLNIQETKSDRMFMNVFFHNKGIEMVDLPKILHHKNVLKTIPAFVRQQEPPIVSYSYTKPIYNTIFNFKSVVKCIDFDVGTADMECNCNPSSSYYYMPVGHVMTGDLGIVKDVELRHLLSKGPSFREQNNINWVLNRRICKDAIKKYKGKWSKKANVDKHVLDEWEQTVYTYIDKRIEYLKRKCIHKRKKQVLKKDKHVKYLEHLQKEYVLVPADKASNNIIVICKKYYIEIMIRELTNTSSSQNTYHSVASDTIHIVDKHLEYMMLKNILVPPTMEELPSLYWLPKMHKTPYGSRFIAASNRCTTKPLSGLLTACLSTVLLHYKEYCNGIFVNTGINCYWVINNSQQVLDYISGINSSSSAKHFDTFDFATLYTNIPHNSLKNNLKILIEEAYKIRGAKYLSINRHGKAYWALGCSNDINISACELIELIEFLIDNIFIGVGNKIFRQHIGIPMGTNCAPLLANLYLFYYEYTYMKKLIKTNFLQARRFNNTVRYIDDLLTFNNPGFSDEIANIYPPELVLKRTTENPLCVSYLDICITLGQHRFFTTIFDKRDNFNFDIVNFPFLSSNIPTNPAYGVYISQLIRISRICCEYSAFIKRHYMITSRLIRQGFWYTRLCNRFKRYSRRHASLFNKFGTSVKNHIHDGICLPASAVMALSKHVTYRCNIVVDT